MITISYAAGYVAGSVWTEVRHAPTRFLIFIDTLIHLHRKGGKGWEPLCNHLDYRVKVIQARADLKQRAKRGAR